MIHIEDVTNDEGFVQIPNSTVRDRSLSWKARGMLCFLLSHANGYNLNYKTVLNGSEKDGDTAARTALIELEERGYLIREQGRQMEGIFGAAVWRIDKRGRFHSRQEEIPLQFDPAEVVPDNVEFMPGSERSKAKPAPAANATEFLETVCAEWHAMILAARPVDVFGKSWQVPRVTDKRLRAIRKRMQESAWMQEWRDALARIAKIEGLHGRVPDRDGRSWECDLDWFLRPDSVTKVIEGKYDSWFRKPAGAAAASTKKAYTGGV